jgi:hypothetical protein
MISVEGPTNDTSGTNEGTSVTNLVTSSSNQVVEEVLIFQCHHCLSIVGDSTHFVGADTEMKTITLSGN